MPLPLSSVPTLSLLSLRLLLLCMIAFSFYFNLHAIPLFDLDEGAFSEATREMLLNRDFISTTLDGQPRYDKPILIYWLQAFSVSLFGINEFAFRLPSALAATLWTLAVYLFLRRVRDEWTGLTGALITASAFEVSVMASAATADALLNLFIASSLFCVYLYWQERQRRWLLLSFACIGLGFLTKGPVAVLIPLAVSFLFFAVKRELAVWLRLLFNPSGIALFLLIATPWYLAEYLKEGEAFIQGFFFKHNIDRFQSPMESHGGSLFYYIPVVLVAVLPYTSLLIKSLASIKQILQDELQLFGLLWFGFVLIFFSLSGTKLPHYVLYGLTGTFLIMALQLRTQYDRFWLYLPALLWFGTLLILPEILGKLLPRVEDPFAQAMLAGYADHFGLAYRLFFIAAFLFSLLCLFDRRFHSSNKLLALGLVSVLGLSLYLLPVVGEIKQGPIKEAALVAKKEGYRVVRYKLNTPSFSVYTRQIMESRRPLPGEIVLTKNKHLQDLPAHEVLYRKGGVVMARLIP